MPIPSIPADKAQHYFYGSLAGLVGAVIGAAVHPYGAAVLSLALACVVGMLKEAMDSRGTGEVSAADVAWTVGGAVPLACASML